MKAKAKNIAIGIGTAVVAGLILQRLSAGGGLGGAFTPAASGGASAPYGNSPKGTMVKFVPSQRAPQTKITMYPQPTYKGKNPYAWGYTTGADGGALI